MKIKFLENQYTPPNPDVVAEIQKHIASQLPNAKAITVEWICFTDNGYVAKVSYDGECAALKVGRVPLVSAARPARIPPAITERVMSAYRYTTQDYANWQLTLTFTWQPFYEGLSYRQVFDKRAAADMPWSQRLRMAMEAVLAVQQLHAMGIAHLDIKPENILFDHRTQEAVLIDFDTAILLAEQDKIHFAANEPLRGTPKYAAPESLQFKEYSHSSDVHALCVLLCSDLGLAPVMQGSEAQSTASRRSSSALPNWQIKPLRDGRQPKIDPSQQVLMRGLNYNPAERPNIETLSLTLLTLAREKLSAVEFNELKMRHHDTRALLAFRSVHHDFQQKNQGQSNLRLPLDISFEEQCHVLARHAKSSHKTIGSWCLWANRTNDALEHIGWLQGSQVSTTAPAAFQRAWRALTNPAASSFGARLAGVDANETRLARPLGYS